MISTGYSAKKLNHSVSEIMPQTDPCQNLAAVVGRFAALAAIGVVLCGCHAMVATQWLSQIGRRANGTAADC